MDNREDNISKCKKTFPASEFHANDWKSFCRTYPHNDIGVINFDSWNAAHGKDFKASLNATMNLAIRCKKQIGECLVIINVDSYRTQSGIKKLSSRQILKESIEEELKHSENIVIDVDSMYEYKNTRRSTKMLTCSIIL